MVYNKAILTSFREKNVSKSPFASKAARLFATSVLLMADAGFHVMTTSVSTEGYFFNCTSFSVDDASVAVSFGADVVVSVFKLIIVVGTPVNVFGDIVSAFATVKFCWRGW